jgi:hypothetical protein
MNPTIVSSKSRFAGSRHNSPERGSGLGVSVLLAWGAIVIWLAPFHVVPRGDDFGYLESVVDTVREQRWVASDWLEPLNLPLTVLSAISYSVTEKFYASTFGLNLLLAWVNLILLWLFLKPVIGSPARRWLLAFGLCLLAPWLNKAISYTGISLGIACTLIAWLSWRRASYCVFFASVLVGFLNRQSALCLLAFPLVGLVKEWLAYRTLNRKAALGIFLTLAIACAVLLTAPSTYAREIYHPLARFSLKNFSAQLALAFVVLASCNAAWGALSGIALKPILYANLARPILPLICMSLSAFIVYSGRYGLLWEAPGMDTYGLLVFVIGTTSGAWLNRWNTRFPAEVVLFVVGYAVIVSVRGSWWDYYFIEPALALLCIPRETAVSRITYASRISSLLALGVTSALPLKAHIVEAENKTVAYERALRAGELGIVELSDAPFGYLGWKLFTSAQKRPDATALSDFLKFVEGARAKFSQGTITVWRDGGRKSIHPSRVGWQLPADYIDRPFPLNNAEWKVYIYRSKNDQR